MSASRALAFAGDVDPAFGVNGRATLQLATATQMSGVVVQSDGRIVVGGARSTGLAFPAYECVLVRLNADGSPDTTFGVAGTAVTRVPNGDCSISALARLADDALIASGSIRPGATYDFAVWKYTRDGMLDPAFGSAGMATRALASENNFAPPLAIAPDGSIALAGHSREQGNNVFAVLRFTAGGQPLAGFGNNGVATTAFPGGDAVATGVALQSDGKAIAGGITCCSRGFVLVRYADNGMPDPGFGSGGIVQRSIGRDPPQLQALAIDDAGRIVAAGQVPGGSAVTTVLMRFSSNGAADATFGDDGIVLTNRMPPGIVAIAFDAQGRIVLAADGLRNDVRTFALLRYDGDGRIDPSFGAGGVVIVPNEGHTEYPHALALQADGAMLIAGDSVDAAGVYRGAVTRLTGNEGSRLPPVVEYWNWVLDHYFIASTPGEIHDLDTGVHANWFRTGEGFRAYAALGPGASPVCRFYIPPGRGDSHFFSASPQECADTRAKFPELVYESDNVFAIGLPDPATGACGAGTVPVYRMWNQRADSNHRYTIVREIRDAMVARGYVAEGYGPDAVAMCAPH